HRALSGLKKHGARGLTQGVALGCLMPPLQGSPHRSLDSALASPPGAYIMVPSCLPLPAPCPACLPRVTMPLAPRVCLFLTAVVFLESCVPSWAAAPTFEQDVRPIVASHCLRCHNGEVQ